ncbi:MAG: dephospho-CoA kinase [Anaerovoracaceae bacterium]
MMHIIGLTGGIGSGKSTASDYLHKLGYQTIDFDMETRKLQEPGQPALKEIVETFGPEALLPDGTMNRKYVGKIVFSDPAEKAKLDAIITKYVDVLINAITDRFEEESRSVTRETNPDDYLQHSVIFYDHPLLFEVPYNIKPAEEAWVLDMDDEVRIRRIQLRDGLSREDILKRIRSQSSRAEKLSRADYVIDNSGSIEDLCRNIDAALADLDSRIE